MIPNDFLDILIYKNYENRPRTSFKPRPDRLTALYAELLHATPITSDAYWRAYRKGLLVTKSWQACQDIKEADDQTDIWEGKLKEAKNALAAWRRRRQSAEKDLSQPLHPHLVDNCNPSPESDEL